MIVSLIILGIGLVGILVTKVSSVSNSQDVVDTSRQSVVDSSEVFYTVWFPKQNIERAELVGREKFRIVKIPESEAFELGIKEDVNIEFVDGMVAKKALDTSSPVFPDSFVAPNQDGYFNLIIEPGYLPVPVLVSKESVLGGVISSGSLVDVLVLTSSTQNLVGRPKIRDLASVSLSPLFIGVKALQVGESKKISSIDSKLSGSSDEEPAQEELAIVLQLTRKQVAQLTVARNIAQIEVHLSTGTSNVSELSADSSDILSDYKSVRELRAQSAILQ